MATSGDSRPVVVGVDARDSARSAVVWAAEEAERRGVPLRLLHATSPGRHGAGDAGRRQTGRRPLDEASLLAADGRPGLEVTTVLADDSPGRALCHESHDACLVVVGSRGLNRLEEFLSGNSVAVPVSAQAACPVAVVLERGGPTDEPPYLVAGVDGSETSRAALRHAFEDAAARDAEVRALWVWQPSLLEAMDEVVVLQKCRRLLFDAVAEQAEAHPGVSATRRVVRGHPVEELVKASEGALAVVVGRRGRGGFTGMRLGSVPHGLLHHAHCPVVIVPTSPPARP
ncbi:universal stress protein [Kitasatospora sp. NPDC093679]|uniref:universal stress protein n=1 Tax=Kitasatospora sp. NPDC093679 TaxID=3154983 RepID=UPI003420360C